MSNDWLDDDTASREDTFERFEALDPEYARGPLPAGGHLVKRAETYGPGTVSKTIGAGVTGMLSHVPVGA